MLVPIILSSEYFGMNWKNITVRLSRNGWTSIHKRVRGSFWCGWMNLMHKFVHNCWCLIHSPLYQKFFHSWFMKRGRCWFIVMSRNQASTSHLLLIPQLMLWLRRNISQERHVRVVLNKSTHGCEFY